MSLHPFVTVFMALWLGGVGIAWLSALNSLTNSQNVEPMTLIPLVMLIFGSLLVTGAFK